MKLNPRFALVGLACLTFNVAYVSTVQAATLSKSAATVAPAAKVTEFMTAYGRKANIEILAKTLVIPKLEDAVKEMENHNVKIFKVADASSKEKKHFAFLPEVPQGLKEKLESEITAVTDESAIFVPGKLKGVQYNILLIAEISPPTNLFHEFTHHLFETQNSEAIVADHVKNAEFEEFLRIYNRRIGSALLDDSSYKFKHWRKQFDGYVGEFSEYLEGSQGHYKAEEVAIETGLARLMIQEKSPHFDFNRSHEGIHTFCQVLAIDSTNTLIDGTIGFMDKLRRAGEVVGEDWTPEEDTIRAQDHAKILNRFQKYRQNIIRFMQIQTDQAKTILETVKK